MVLGHAIFPSYANNYRDPARLSSKGSFPEFMGCHMARSVFTFFISPWQKASIRAVVRKVSNGNDKTTHGMVEHAASTIKPNKIEKYECGLTV
jgi:hypothetical protein